MNQCVVRPTCTGGQTYNASTNTCNCPADRPIWDTAYNVCQSRTGICYNQHLARLAACRTAHPDQNTDAHRNCVMSSMTAYTTCRTSGDQTPRGTGARLVQDRQSPVPSR